jgi:hypothetical protein
MDFVEWSFLVIAGMGFGLIAVAAWLGSVESIQNSLSDQLPDYLWRFVTQRSLLKALNRLFAALIIASASLFVILPARKSSMQLNATLRTCAFDIRSI